MRALEAINQLPRYSPGTAHLLGCELAYPDAPSFVSAFHSIFLDEVYAFPPTKPDPFIIDGGANIGLATLYWRLALPGSTVWAFEPDPNVFTYLHRNLRAHGVLDANVRLHRAALWTEETAMDFLSEGADAGRLAHLATDGLDVSRTTTTAIRLRDLLGRPVDLLKLDIEGAELEVVEDCRDHLSQVNRLFVEFHGFSRAEQRFDHLLALLREAGFRYHITDEMHAVQPFVVPLDHMGMDNQLNVFAWRP